MLLERFGQIDEVGGQQRMPFLSMVQNYVPQDLHLKVEIKSSADISVKSFLQHFFVEVENPQSSIHVRGKIQQQAIYVPQDFHHKAVIKSSVEYLRQIVS